MAKKAGDATESERKGTSKAAGKKRLANAKVKATADSDKKKTRAVGSASKAAGSKEGKHTARNVVISVFAILMALSMMLPSLSTIFSNNNQNRQATEEAQEAEAEAAEEAEEAEEKTGIDLVDDNYTKTITPLEDKLKEDSKDLATLLNLGNDYMSWAYAASQYVSYGSDSYEEDQEHVNDLYAQAVDYYDQYLKLNDSNAVKVNRALCQFYGGESEEAQEALEQLTKDAPDYGPAWANLGLIYETNYDMDKATETYKKAAEVDADDEYGAKTFANQRLTYMNMDDVQRTTDTLTSADSTQGLSDVLNSSSGLSV